MCNGLSIGARTSDQFGQTCRHRTATLMMETRKDHLCITVKDEGKGFDCAVEAAKAPSSEISSKFGLYSIQERMRGLGGSLDIQSSPDTGTTAILMLPLVGSVGQQGAKISALPLAAPGSRTDTISGDRSTIRLVIVDDHVMIRQGLRTMLEAYHGYPRPRRGGEWRGSRQGGTHDSARCRPDGH